MSEARFVVNASMKKMSYVSQREGAYWVGHTRVSLDSIVYEFLNGQIAHRAEIDAYLREGHAQYKRERDSARRADPAFYQKLVNARQRHS